jgi:cysteinyl-tRNA synthetase
VKHWLHGAFLLVEGRKMSKSLGNFFTLRDLLAKGFTGREIRYLLLTAHYRETFNFTLEGLQGARTALARIDECVSKLREMAAGAAAAPEASLLTRFSDFMDQDLNVAGAWGAVFDWVRETNKHLAEQSVNGAQAASGLAAWNTLNTVLGLGHALHLEDKITLADGISLLLEQRQAARAAKDFKRSDAIRDELKAKGWLIEDTPKGPKLKKL